MILRLGLPLVGGALPAAARALGAPLLVSANALARYRRSKVWPHDRAFASFRLEAPDLDGMDVALDSAGFVAHAHYGAFPWGVADYIELAACRPWAWWAQMDACCEEEIAAHPGIVRLRQAETIRLLGECERAARRRGIPRPIPVLQGRTPADYVWHAGQVHLADRPLVGVGSMCRRDVHGPDGLVAVVEALDRTLPAICRLHLFGVKSAGLAVLSTHPRVVSVDSMAWDVAARAEARTGRTMAVRVRAMRRWYEAQMRASASRCGVPGVLPFGGEPQGVGRTYEEWGELLADNEIDLRAAAHFAAWDEYAYSLGNDPYVDDDCDDLAPVVDRA